MAEPRPQQDERSFAQKIEPGLQRRLRSRRRRVPSALRGIATMGMVGWSVTVPAIAGAVLGAWLEGNSQPTRHWTLTLLVAGLALGIINAARWLARQDREIRAREEESNDE